MKRLITTILAGVLAISAFAKTQSELISEFRVLPNDLKVRQDWATENKADILAVWESWKTSAAAKSDDGLSGSALADNRTLRWIFGKLCDNHYAEMQPMSDIAFIRIGCWQVVPKKGAVWYAQLKAADFVVDGVALDDWGKCVLSNWFADDETMMSLPAAVCIRNAAYPKIVAKSLLSMSDVSQAKAKINEIKQAYILAGLDVPPTVQAVSKELTSRLLDSKLTK